jgi:isopenicillin-N epimerase
MNSLREQFLLDPDVTFLNHGSFGATPRPVLAVHQDWQRRLEYQPVQFLASDVGEYLAEARATLGVYLGIPSGDLVYVPNTTFGVNVVARSLDLGPGDEVLTTDHEYGACERVWHFLSRKREFDIIRQTVPLPLTTDEAIINQIWQGVTPRTRIIFLSHITSPTAARLPVEAVCARARESGILTLVDGAHAPGQLPLDLAAMGADFYTGNCHKWLCAPKGSAFLYVRPEVQQLIEPLIVGWGWNSLPTFSYGSAFLDYLQYPGTDDYSAYLSVPAAIQFQADHNWPAVRQVCHDLASEAIGRINDLTGLAPVYPAESEYFIQMALAELPPIDDIAAFKKQLYQKYKVEIPCYEWNGRPYIRISVQAYNESKDIDKLLEALNKVLQAW